MAAILAMPFVDRDRVVIGGHNMDTYRQRLGAKPDRAYPNMDLVAPDLGFVDLARGLGVEAMRVTTPGQLRPALEKALGAGRTFPLNVAIEGRP